MKHVDTLIHAGRVVPVEPAGTLRDHTLAVSDGRIVDLLPTPQARTTYEADNEVELPEHALIPGLVNAHTHAAMSLMRGLADDLPLMEWLNDHIWPAESRWVGSGFVADGTRLAMAEMLRGGVTCFNDMYFFPEEVAREASQAGMRAVVGLILIDFPTAWARDADEYLHKGMELHDHVRSDPLISTAFAPHAPYTVSDRPLEKVVMYAEELDVPIHMHVHETAHEVEMGLEQHGRRPLKRLEELGLLSPRLAAVHMTQLLDEEIERCAEAGGNVIHCPESNLKLANGFAPVPRMRQAGINLALGTDGAASNNDLDMLGEMRTAALLGKGVAKDATAFPAESALRAATLGGAKALGLDDITGSLEVGKAADITAIHLGGIETQPLYHPISQLVYATSRDKVSDVWVAGQHLLKERALTTLDEAAILKKSAEWAGKIEASDQAQ